ncbi:MAG TPA: ATP-dependent DNA helicase RecQ [Candidatus Thermoplasmatota archaeon]|nr:ATP-dependent DNA helicase RecQ [Candidatus Thermoplasmatota archaeon]
MTGPAPDELAQAEALARRHFGFPTLRAGQAETLARILRGEDVLAILPTGGGKSLCYQLPGVLGKRATLVVSPLVALMKDQLDALPPPMRAAATSVTGELDAREARERIAEIARNRYRLVYAAPERLRSVPLLQALRAAGVERLVVDEAHCVSTWGPDFRPDYLSLSALRRALGGPQLVAFTATAPPRVTEDILERLGPMHVVRTSIHRPNLRLEAILAKDADEKLAHLLQLCRETPHPGIVYCSSRVKTEQLAAALKTAGIRAEAYHAGLPDRGLIQDAFMRNDIEVLISTVAFGMGVDKGDIRFVFHHDPSASLENYWQEAGRAGRDGQAARCVALATGADGGQLRSRAKLDLPSLALLEKVWALIVAGLGEDRYSIVDPEQLDALDADDVKCRVALSVLQEADAIERLPDAPRHLDWHRETVTLFDAAARLGVAPEAVESTILAKGDPYRPGARAILLFVKGRPEQAENVLAAYAERASKRGDDMMAYVRTSTCRHAFLRKHFGEDDIPLECGNCDTCLRIRHEAAQVGDEETDARAVLDALGSVRGLGEQNLVYMLRGDPLAPPWTDGKPGAGALGFRSASKVKALIARLERAGYIAREALPSGGVALRLARAAGEGPVLPVHPGGTRLGGSGTPRRSEENPGPTRDPPGSRLGDAASEGLFAALKDWRRAKAASAGVPAYVVAHDSVLAAIAEARPATPEALRAIKGMGPKKVEAYGEEILGIVRAHPS